MWKSRAGGKAGTQGVSSARARLCFWYVSGLSIKLLKKKKKSSVLQVFSRRESRCFYCVFQVLHNLPPSLLSMLKFLYITPLGEPSTWAEWMCSLPLDSPIIFYILTFGHVCSYMGNFLLPHGLPHFHPFSKNHFKMPLFLGSFSWSLLPHLEYA